MNLLNSVVTHSLSASYNIIKLLQYLTFKKKMFKPTILLYSEIVKEKKHVGKKNYIFSYNIANYTQNLISFLVYYKIALKASLISLRILWNFLVNRRVRLPLPCRTALPACQYGLGVIPCAVRQGKTIHWMNFVLYSLVK